MEKGDLKMMLEIIAGFVALMAVVWIGIIMLFMLFWALGGL